MTMLVLGGYICLLWWIGKCNHTTNIGDYAFMWCENLQIKSIPDIVTIIRDNVIKKLFIINNNINKIVLLLLLSNQLFRAISDNDKLGKKSLLMEIR